MTTTDRIKLLLELGEADRGRDWPDYLQYGFVETDVPALLDLVADEALDQASSDSAEVWAPLHAWRTLGQLGSSKAAVPLIDQFDRLCEDDLALPELPIVMCMLGEPAITPLTGCMNDLNLKEFGRVMAADSLAEIAKRQTACRERIIQCYCDCMRGPDLSAHALNGLLIGRLLDLDAKEAIDDIRLFFAKDCVDITCAGDLEEVEIELGFRSKRSTPKPDCAQLYGLESLQLPEKPQSDDIFETIDFYFMRYGHDNSVLDVSELDGFFAALACAPDTVLPSRWMPAIWGGEDQAPAWQGKQEINDFTRIVFTLYNHVMQSMNEDDYEALFLEREAEGKTNTIVDDWCEGFLRGINLWGPLNAADAALTEDCIQVIKLFATEAGFAQLETMDENSVIAQQRLIEPAVRRLFRHFFEQRNQASAPYVRDNLKVGRNDPCPCGSGKKHKRCYLH